jgi:hypothetical protein
MARLIFPRFLWAVRDSPSRSQLVLKDAGREIDSPPSLPPQFHIRIIHTARREHPPGAVYFPAALLEFRAIRSRGGEGEKGDALVIRCPNKCGQVRRVTVINAESRGRLARTRVPGAATRSPLTHMYLRNWRWLG